MKFLRSKCPASACLPLSFLLFAQSALASQSSISNKVSYNSEKQLGYSVAGLWAFGPNTFATGSFSYARSAASEVGRTENYYQGGLGVGYSLDVLTAEVGATAAANPLTKTASFGYILGFTYVVTDFWNPEVKIPTTRLPNTRRSEPPPQRSEEKYPLFWLRFMHGASTMDSALLPANHDRGTQTITSLAAYYPVSNQLITGLGVAFYQYDDPNGFFSSSFRSAGNSELRLLGTTLQALPANAVLLDLAWQLSDKNSFFPRYQATQLQANRRWAHTLDVGLRHQVDRNWAAIPTYEVSLDGDKVVSGLLVEVSYAF